MESLAIPAAELFGSRYGRKPVAVEFSKERWSRGAAWDRALRNPPIVHIFGRWYVPYREHAYSGYRKSHTEKTWRWVVAEWQPFEESLRGKQYMAHLLFGWLLPLCK